MSSRARNRDYLPDPKGRAYTSQDLADSIARTLHTSLGLRPGRILEPGAGKGVFVKAARTVWPTAHITAVEPFATEVDLKTLSDAFIELPLEDSLKSCPHAQFDLVLGNPSYPLCRQHLELLLPRTKSLAFLLRLNWLGSLKRKAFFRQYPPTHMLPIVPRPSFERIMIHKVTGEEKIFVGGNDSTEYALFVWTPDPLIAGWSKMTWLWTR